jgi:hypothetical protein
VYLIHIRPLDDTLIILENFRRVQLFLVLVLLSELEKIRSQNDNNNQNCQNCRDYTRYASFLLHCTRPISIVIIAKAIFGVDIWFVGRTLFEAYLKFEFLENFEFLTNLNLYHYPLGHDPSMFTALTIQYFRTRTSHVIITISMAFLTYTIRFFGFVFDQVRVSKSFLLFENIFKRSIIYHYMAFLTSMERISPMVKWQSVHFHSHN